jgi:hypothetical protein
VPELEQVLDFLASSLSVIQIGVDYGLVTQGGLDYGQAWVGFGLFQLSMGVVRLHW